VNLCFHAQIELLEEWLVLHGRESETEELRPWRIEVMTSMSRHRVEAAYRTLERGMPQFQEGYDDTLRTLEDAQVSINRFILPSTVSINRFILPSTVSINRFILPSTVPHDEISSGGRACIYN